IKLQHDVQVEARCLSQLLQLISRVAPLMAQNLVERACEPRTIRNQNNGSPAVLQDFANIAHSAQVVRQDDGLDLRTTPVRSSTRLNGSQGKLKAEKSGRSKHQLSNKQLDPTR